MKNVGWVTRSTGSWCCPATCRASCRIGSTDGRCRSRGAICRSGSGGAGKVFNGTNCGIVGITQRDIQICLHRYKIEGEKSGFHRTDVLRQFRFPMKVHGQVSEGIVWSAIATRFKPRFVNDPLRIVHFEPSIMRSPFSAGLHADGLSLWQREILCNELRWFFTIPSGS